MAAKKSAKRRRKVKRVRPELPVAATSNKVQITLRLDADVVDYFRGKGPGYQGRMGDCLQLMMGQQKYQAAMNDPGEPWISNHPQHAAMVNPLFRPRKVQMALRLNAELLRHFRATGKGYQTRMNRDLRLVMVEMISNEEERED